MPTTSTNPIRVLLIDDHVVMRTALRLVIESQPRLAVVGEAMNRAEALKMAAREQPDIILLDVDLGEENGIDMLPDVFAAAKEARVIVLTGLRDSEEYRRAVRLGAVGLVLKDQALGVLIQAIKKVHAGEVWLESSMVTRALAEMSSQRAVGEEQTKPEAAKIARLTARERAVIALICEGLTNKQIAGRMFISQTTVVHHLTSIFDKLGVANRLELVTYVYRHGLTQPPR
jgi:two-component system nitrate/nitrite response regulator NarL